uniref:Uncharacterized protein n=1 Tax=viral metagenome TaxID=1070528 RepID=A0A6H1ZML6_9ZZZZ
MKKDQNNFSETKYIRDILTDMTAEMKTLREVFANFKIEFGRMSVLMEKLQENIHIFSQDHDIIINLDARLKELEKDGVDIKGKALKLDEVLKEKISEIRIDMSKFSVYAGIVATIIASIIGIFISKINF